MCVFVWGMGGDSSVSSHGSSVLVVGQISSIIVVIYLCFQLTGFVYFFGSQLAGPQVLYVF